MYRWIVTNTRLALITTSIRRWSSNSTTKSTMSAMASTLETISFWPSWLGAFDPFGGTENGDQRKKSYRTSRLELGSYRIIRGFGLLQHSHRHFRIRAGAGAAANA